MRSRYLSLSILLCIISVALVIQYDPFPEVYSTQRLKTSLNQTLATWQQKILNLISQDKTTDSAKESQFTSHKNQGDLSEATPQYVCRANTKKGITRKESTRVYKWRDESGRIHYSDRSPAQASQAESIQLQGALQYFSLNLQMDKKGLPPYFRDRLTYRVEKAYQVLADLLPENLLHQVDVNLWVFNTKKDYLRFQRQYAPDVVSASQGFHNAGHNVAATWRKTDPQAVSTSVHEAVHVMNAGIFGRMPRWLNEGMAEYLENIEVYGQSANIPLSQQWLQNIRGRRLNLSYVLQANSDQWQGSLRNNLYAHSWGLVYFLMSSNHGRTLLRQFLVMSAKDPCQEIDTMAYFQRHYSGGLNRMDAELRSWIRKPKTMHRI